MTMHQEAEAKIDNAVASHQLLRPAAKNIRTLLASTPSDLYSRVIEELIAGGEWAELNDRFYKTLEFGTRGIRVRTIRKIVTTAERDDAPPDQPPAFPLVGTNANNFYNVHRPTQTRAAYVNEC